MTYWFIIHRSIKRLAVKSSVQWLGECYFVASTTIRYTQFTVGKMISPSPAFDFFTDDKNTKLNAINIFKNKEFNLL